MTFCFTHFSSSAPGMLLRSLARSPGVAAHRTFRRGLSFVQGSSEPPLVEATFSQFYENVLLQKYASRPALVSVHEPQSCESSDSSPHLRWSYEEMWKHVNALSRGLIGLGVKKGDRVAVLMGNNSAYASLQWACANIGAILVTINPAYRVNELVATLNHVAVSHLFIVPCIRSSNYLRLLAEHCPSLANSRPGDIQAEELPHLKHIIAVDNIHDKSRFNKELEHFRPAVDFREILIRGSGSREERVQEQISKTLNPHDVINLQFTSGTTGAPKAVSLTHHNLLNNAISVGSAMLLTERDILCNVPPLFHCFDEFAPSTTLLYLADGLYLRLILGNLAAFTHGACIVYPSEIFDPNKIVDSLVEEKCTALHGVPTHFLAVLAEVERRRKVGEELDLSQLRTGIASGSSIPIDLMKRLIEKMNLRDLTVAYGMTETSPVSFQTTPADPIEKRVETVGKILPHCTAKIVNPNGETVPRGTPGEIWIKGYNVQKGYWQDERHTREATRVDETDGRIWMCTGDEGIMDEEGYVKIVGRIKDIIIRGGENLFPIQIENALTSSPSIREAAVVAVPDAHYGEVVGAWIVLEENYEEIEGGKMSREDVKKQVSKQMNPQNAPQYVWFLGDPNNTGAEDILPKTASGKVMKHVLRDWSRGLAKAGVGKVTSS